MKRLAISLCGVAFFLAASAHGATVTYSDTTAFSNVTTGITTIDFGPGDLGPVAGGILTTYSPITVSGTYCGSPNLSVVASPSPETHDIDWGTEMARIGGGCGNASDGIRINLGAGFTAAAIRIASFWEGQTVVVKLSTGDTYSVSTANAPPATFWGFTSDVAVTYIDVSGGGNFAPLVGQIQYGVAGAAGDGGGETPEAMTLLLIGSGLLIFRGMKRFVPVSAA
ncbi:MAG: hypothetical protein ABI823_03490 [Bryobacteraceae bacterium]